MINRLDFALGNGNRPYQYKVSIELPTILTSVIQVDNDKVDTLCKKATIPDMQIEQTSLFVHGREVKVPFTTTYSTESVLSFYLDDDYYMRHIIEFWMLSIDAYRVFNDTAFINNLPPSLGVLDKAKAVFNKIKDTALKEVKKYAAFFASNIASNLGFSSTEDYLNKYLEGMNKVPEDNIFGKVMITPLNYNMSEICTYTLYNVYPINISQINYANESIGSISEFDATFYYTHYTIDKPESLIGNIAGDLGGKVIDKLTKTFG